MQNRTQNITKCNPESRTSINAEKLRTQLDAVYTSVPHKMHTINQDLTECRTELRNTLNAGQTTETH